MSAYVTGTTIQELHRLYCDWGVETPIEAKPNPCVNSVTQRLRHPKRGIFSSVRFSDSATLEAAIISTDRGNLRSQTSPDVLAPMDGLEFP